MNSAITQTASSLQQPRFAIVAQCYYSLAVGAVDKANGPLRVKKRLARHSIPLMVLARLAIDRQYPGCNLGQGLQKDAIRCTPPLLDDTNGWGKLDALCYG